MLRLADATAKANPSTEDGRSTADALAAELMARISAGELLDGSFLPAERELMAEHRVSRTVVREAVAKLTSQGLLDSRPRFRRVVRRPGYDTALTAITGVVSHLLGDAGGVKSLYDVRIFVEAALARNAALHARKEDIVALRDALKANEREIGNSANFYTTDTAFHSVLYDIPRNPAMPVIHKAFTSWLSSHWDKMLRSPEHNRINYLAHRELFLGILERDPDAAERALRNHLVSAWEFVRGTFDRSE